MYKVKTIFFLFLSLFFIQQAATAQELSMKVTRCTQVDRDQAIRNIFVDENNVKWVGVDGGMYQVNACDLVEKIDYKSGQIGLASIPSGNSTFKITTSDVQKLVKVAIDRDNKISASYFDEENDLLYVGTQTSGLFVFKTFPNLKLEKEMHMDNTKLKSNRIESIFQDGQGVMYVGTDEGILRGKGSKWEWEKNLYNITRILEHGRDIWILSDGDLWVAKNGRSFENYPPFEEAIEGKILDFTFDAEGYLYIVSQSIAKCDVKADTFEVYGQFQDYLSQYATSVAADNDGGIWVGTRDKGIYFLEKNEAITVTILAENEPTCEKPNQKANLSVKIYGGTEPYTYKWSNSLKGENPSGVAAGKYTLSITDADGRKKTASIDIANPSVSLAVNVLSDESGPDEKDGKAELTISGGKSPYKIAWDNGEKLEKARKLKGGPHSVTVTDRNGCTAEASFNLSSKSAPLGLFLAESKSIKCAGTSKAALDASVVGGKGPYTYTWDSEAAKGKKPTDLPKGMYRLTVTDSEGSTILSIYEITEPEIITKSISVVKPASTGNADGQALVKASGGTGAFSYAWDNGETTAKATKLPAGTHKVTLTDANGCLADVEIDIPENVLKLQADIEVITELKCADANEGALLAKASGGKPPYSYIWNRESKTNAKVENLAAGNYKVIITDAVGTTQSKEIDLKAAKAIELTATVDSPASTGNKDGEANVKAKGGASGFAYKWDNGETKSTAKKLGPGTHTVTVTDKNGCTSTASVDISENILPLQASIEVVSDIKCAGEKTGAINLAVKGGKAPFSYKWNDAGLSGEKITNLKSGTYEVTVTDAEGTTKLMTAAIKSPTALEATVQVDAPASTGNADGKATLKIKGGTGTSKIEWDNGETGMTATKLGPGAHVATISDENNCTTSVSVNISENILPLQVSIEMTEAIICNNDPKGAVKVAASGGKSPYKYEWNSPYITGETGDGLPPGDYVLTLTDAEGTKAQATIKLTEPARLQAQIGKRVGAMNENAKDGKVLLAVTGGTKPYTYAWDNSETTIEATKLNVGMHTATVTDVNGCQATITCEIKAKILPDLNPNLLSSGKAVRMESLNFDADSTNFREESLPVLDEVYEFLIDNPTIVIEVGGHTNNVPPPAYCDQLSSARAKAVADYIVSKGVDPKRIFHKGYGKRNPFTTNATPLGRKKNQRVEIRVLKVDFGE